MLKKVPGIGNLLRERYVLDTNIVTRRVPPHRTVHLWKLLWIRFGHLRLSLKSLVVQEDIRGKTGWRCGVRKGELWLNIESSSGLYTSSNTLGLRPCDDLVPRKRRSALGASVAGSNLPSGLQTPQNRGWKPTSDLVVQGCVIQVLYIRQWVNDER